MTRDGIALREDGLCAASFDRVQERGAARVEALNIETGVRSLIDPELDAPLSVQWIPIETARD
jgi:hypothetical protein